jgi:hypothetical protein
MRQKILVGTQGGRKQNVQVSPALPAWPSARSLSLPARPAPRFYPADDDSRSWRDHRGHPEPPASCRAGRAAPGPGRPGPGHPGSAGSGPAWRAWPAASRVSADANARHAPPRREPGQNFRGIPAKRSVGFCSTAQPGGGLTRPPGGGQGQPEVSSFEEAQVREPRLA